eukprot:CAMPEP_0115834320 /NCGR_PEP_ID=MMETSP0287-20121206/3623_1 /TAXON_ID=412157 /ORGANISM="Chrysochromulina rotalis, Strain UIO044" /LENGTH=117 /DNA_ID=CAMNT_0003287753 /DNA_START=148 /DNA_END=499 /DNA_ORIENTATION=+
MTTLCKRVALTDRYVYRASESTTVDAPARRLRYAKVPYHRCQRAAVRDGYVLLGRMPATCSTATTRHPHTSPHTCTNTQPPGVNISVPQASRMNLKSKSMAPRWHLKRQVVRVQRVL